MNFLSGPCKNLWRFKFFSLVNLALHIWQLNSDSFVFCGNWTRPSGVLIKGCSISIVLGKLWLSWWDLTRRTVLNDLSHRRHLYLVGGAPECFLKKNFSRYFCNFHF